MRFGASWAGAAGVHWHLFETPPSALIGLVGTEVGTWLSLVERTLGVGEVASSNLVVPTIYFFSIFYSVWLF